MKTKVVKRILAMLLALLLVLGAMPATVMAATMNISGTNDFIVPAGTTATVTGNVYGTITVSGGTLRLVANHTITGTVAVQDGGTFTMSAGTITGEYNRGVSVVGANTIFTMAGGTIQGNGDTGMDGGGGVLVHTYARFYMYGGTIRNNNFNGHGGGGGVRIVNATFTMSGNALIYNNFATMDTPIPDATSVATGGGVRINHNATFHMLGGRIARNTGRNGGGVYVGHGSTFNLDGGRIEDNTATFETGGGVMVVDWSTFNMYSGRIYNNTAPLSGGGVVISRRVGADSTQRSFFYMHGGYIQGNATTYAASIVGGAGVRLVHYSEMTMAGGTIGGGGNLGNRSASFGGGISVDPYVRLEIDDGTIINNRAATNGGGIWVRDQSSTVEITRASIVNNIAVQYGGGIWAQSYSNLAVSQTVQFRGNRANRPYDHGFGNTDPVPNQPPMGGIRGSGGYIGNINQASPWETGSIRGAHLLNNFDINFVGEPTNLIILPRIGDIGLEKTLRMPAGTTTPSASFTFEVELVEIRDGRGAVVPVANPPQVQIDDITISFPQGASTAMRESTTDLFVTRGGVVGLCDVLWPLRPGVFTFRVEEVPYTSNTVAPNIMEYDDTVFYMRVYVGWLDDNFRHLGVLRTNIRPYNEDCAPGAVCPICNDGKSEAAEFTNVLLTSSQLEIRKLVAGMGDMSKAFPFTLELQLPPAASDITVAATLTRLDRSSYGQLIGGTTDYPIAFNVGANGVVTPATALSFMHGDIIVFSELPVGTTYTLTEPAVPHYTQTAVVTSGGLPGGEFEQDEDEDYALIVTGMVSSGANAGGVSNRVVVENYLMEAPETGVLLSNVPFGLMVALGAGALVAAGVVAILYKKK